MFRTHLADDEEDDSHGSTEQSDQHQELEPENKTLKRTKMGLFITSQLRREPHTAHNTPVDKLLQ